MRAAFNSLEMVLMMVFNSEINAERVVLLAAFFSFASIPATLSAATFLPGFGFAAF